MLLIFRIQFLITLADGNSCAPSRNLTSAIAKAIGYQAQAHSMGELAYRDSASPAHGSQREAQEGRQASSHPSQVKGREAMQPDVRPSSLEALSFSDSDGWCRCDSSCFSLGCAGVQKLVRGARLTAPRFACHALSRQPRAPETSSWLRQVANKPDDTVHKCNCRRCTNVVDVGQSASSWSDQLASERRQRSVRPGARAERSYRSVSMMMMMTLTPRAHALPSSR